MFFDKTKMDSALARFLDNTFELNDLPGLSIGVSIGADYEFRGAKPANLTPDSIFHCASVSKLMTTSAIMKCLEQEDAGFSLDSKMIDILPDYCLSDPRYSDVRLWNMLTHTAGIGDCDDYEWYRPDLSSDAIRSYINRPDVAGQAMLWEPQNSPMADENRFRYSNNAFEILGHLAASKSSLLFGENLAYEDVIDQCIFKPLGMTASSMRTYGRADWGTDAMAKPHEKDDSNTIQELDVYPYNPAHAPSSTLTTNTGDLLKWGRAHILEPRFFKDETYDKMWSDYAIVPNNHEHMGIGWFMRTQDYAGKTYKLLGHEGTDDGFRASFWICPQLEAVTVVLSNMSGAPVKKINKKLFAAMVAALE